MEVEQIISAIKATDEESLAMGIEALLYYTDIGEDDGHILLELQQAGSKIAISVARLFSSLTCCCRIEWDIAGFNPPSSIRIHKAPGLSRFWKTLSQVQLPLFLWQSSQLILTRSNTLAKDLFEHPEVYPPILAAIQDATGEINSKVILRTFFAHKLALTPPPHRHGTCYNK